MQRDKNVVLVTGSSGLIGSAVINRLADRFEMVGFDREGPPYPPPTGDCIDIDLTSDEAVENALTQVREKYGNQIASVIHLAAYYNFSGEDSPLYQKVTIDGTKRLLNRLKSFDVEQFVFSSTMLVHKPCKPGERINESSPLEPKWPYPKSKVETEELILKEHGSMPVVLARIAGVYDDIGHSIPIVHQIQRIYEKDITSRLYPGDPSHGQAFIHLNDTIEALEKIVLKRKDLPKEATFLLGEPDTVGYGELHEAITRLIHGERIELRRIPKVVAKAGAIMQNVLPGIKDQFIKPWMIDLADDHYELDISRAESLLGWNPRHSLRDSLSKITSALKADPVGWYKKHKLPVENIKKEPVAAGSSS